MLQQFDVVIVGGGMAGLEVAQTLAARGVDRVAVIEAGGAAGPASARRGPETTVPPHYAERDRPARLGGRSLDWHGVVLRIDRETLADPVWPASIVAALTGAGGLYDEVESDLAAWAGRPLAAARNRADPLMVRLLSEVAGAQARPVPLAVRCGGDQTGPARAYTALDRLHERAAVDEGATTRFVCGAAVADIDVAHGAVRGVRLVDGSVLGAPCAVLAAGTLENARLVCQATRALGPLTGLCDHLVQGFAVALPAAALGLEPGTDGFAFVEGSSGSRANLFARCRADGAGVAVLDVWSVGEQIPSVANSVMVRAHARQPWSLVVQPGLSAEDRALVAAQQAELRGVWRAWRAAVLPERDDLTFSDFLSAPRPFDAAAAAALGAPGEPQTYAWPLGWVDHESGLLPLGARLDDRGALDGVAGLHVAGPATFPRPGAANPSLTTLALARHTARAIAA